MSFAHDPTWCVCVCVCVCACVRVGGNQDGGKARHEKTWLRRGRQVDARRRPCLRCRERARTHARTHIRTHARHTVPRWLLTTYQQITRTLAKITYAAGGKRDLTGEVDARGLKSLFDLFELQTNVNSHISDESSMIDYSEFCALVERSAMARQLKEGLGLGFRI